MEDVETKRRGRPPGSGNVRAEAPVSAVETIEVRVLRDFWTDDGRVRAGAVIAVPVKDALKGIKNGSLDPVED